MVSCLWNGHFLEPVQTVLCVDCIRAGLAAFMDSQVMFSSSFAPCQGIVSRHFLQSPAASIAPSNDPWAKQTVRLHLDGDHMVARNHGETKHSGLPL